MQKEGLRTGERQGLGGGEDLVAQGGQCQNSRGSERVGEPELGVMVPNEGSPGLTSLHYRSWLPTVVSENPFDPYSFSSFTHWACLGG